MGQVCQSMRALDKLDDHELIRYLWYLLLYDLTQAINTGPDSITINRKSNIGK